jgi:hypothetical protein
MTRSTLGREQPIADQALTHFPIYNAEHLADLIGAKASSEWMVHQLAPPQLKT